MNWVYIAECISYSGCVTTMMTHGKDKLELIKIRHTHTTKHTRTHRGRYFEQWQWRLNYICQHNQLCQRSYSYVWRDLLEYYIFRLDVTANTIFTMHLNIRYERIFVFLCHVPQKIEMISFIRFTRIDFHLHTMLQANVQRIKMIMVGQQHHGWCENSSVKFSTSKTSFNIVFNKHPLSPSADTWTYTHTLTHTVSN